MNRLFITLVFLLIMVLTPYGISSAYQITRFNFDGNSYQLPEPMLDFELFKPVGKMLLHKDQSFAVGAVEATNADQSNWVILIICVEAEKNGPRVYIVGGMISTGLTSRDPKKMTTDCFIDEAYFLTGKPSFKLKTVKSLPELDSFIRLKRAEHL